MKNERILVIDFGSAYTKIAVRSGWDGDAITLDQLSCSCAEPSFCVPSVVARVSKTSKEDQWVIGQVAADLIPSANTAVYRNWKARLFVGASGDSGACPGNVEDETVAVEFFRQLRGAIAESLHWKRLSELPTRVCVPHFEERSALERVAYCLKSAGWRLTDNEPVLFEPEANAWGVLTRGSNRTHQPRAVSYQRKVSRAPSLNQMIQYADFMRALRSGALTATPKSFSILVVDVGAFTTDFAFLTLQVDFRNEDYVRPAVRSASVPLGISSLDHEVQEQLGEQFVHLARHMPASEWESKKRLLYQGKAAAFALQDGRTQRFGAGEQSKLISDVVDQFAERLVGARRTFLASNSGGHADLQVLTGGGLLIKRLADALSGATPSIRTLNFGGDSGVDAGISQRVAERRAAQNLLLARAATALGGASVVFG